MITPTERAALRKQAADAGITETGRYVEWLEEQVLHLRRHREELFKTNNLELQRKREAQSELAGYRADAGETPFADFLLRKREWSLRTFGADYPLHKVLAHLHKEIEEIRQEPCDLTEWIDAILLSIDGFWRAGGDLRQLEEMLRTKHAINEWREWPEPTPDEPTCHVKDGGEAPRAALIAEAARALMRQYTSGGPYWEEMQALKNAYLAEVKP